MGRVHDGALGIALRPGHTVLLLSLSEHARVLLHFAVASSHVQALSYHLLPQSGHFMLLLGHLLFLTLSPQLSADVTAFACRLLVAQVTTLLSTSRIRRLHH